MKGIAKMLITVRPIRCGNRNCIGLEGYVYGSYPPKLIVIEDVWDLPQETIEKAMAGLISHETIEWILAKWEAEGAIPFFLDLHDLIRPPFFLLEARSYAWLLQASLSVLSNRLEHGLQL